MAKKKVSQKLIAASSKIASIGDLLLAEEGHDWEINELHLVPKNSNLTEIATCKLVWENGAWVMKC